MRMLIGPGAPDQWVAHGKRYTIVRRGRRRRIDEDDPSVYGEHLLGHEGEWAQEVEVEVTEEHTSKD